MKRDDDDLRELFAARRPDPAAFAAGVAARLRARGDAGAAAAAGGDGDIVPTARAAATLPLDGGLLLSGKGLWSLLSMPVLLLASVGGLFVGGVASLRRGARPVPPAAVSPRAFDRRGPLALLLLLLAPWLLTVAAGVSGTHIADGLLAMVLAAQAAMVLLVRHESQHGRAERAQVAGIAFGVLAMFAFCGGLFALANEALYPEAAWKGTGAWVLALGMVALARLRPWPERLLALLAVLFAAVFVGEPLGPRRELDAAVRSAAAAAQPATTDLLGWSRLAAAVDSLAALGVPAAPRDTLRADVARAIANGPLHPQVLTGAARLGLVDAATWRLHTDKRAVAFVLDQWLAGDGPLHKVVYDEWELHALLATRELDAVQRERLVRRIEASWPQPDDGMPLQGALLCVRWLDLLGRPDLAAAHGEAVRALLPAHQLGAGAVGPGGFGEFPREVQGSDRQATHAALELMHRFGAPAGVDLAALHRHLRHEIRFARSVGRGEWERALVVRADLLRCERAFGPFVRSWGTFVWDERLLLGVGLLVLLCLWAVWQSPSARAVRGVQP